MRVLRARLYERAAGRAGRGARRDPALAARLRRPLREGAHLQLPPEPGHRPPRGRHACRCASRCSRGNLGRAHRGPRRRGAPAAARGAGRRARRRHERPTPTSCASSSWASPSATTTWTCRARTSPLFFAVDQRPLRAHAARVPLRRAARRFSEPDGAECVLRPAQIASCGVTGLGYREGARARRRAGRGGRRALRDRPALDRGRHDRGRLGRRGRRGRPASCWRAASCRSTRSAWSCWAATRWLAGAAHLAPGGRRAPWSAPSSRCTPSRPRSTSASCSVQGEPLAEASSLREAADAVHDFLLGPARRRSSWPRRAAEPEGAATRPSPSARCCGAARPTWPSAARRRRAARRRAAAGPRPRRGAPRLYTDSERPLTPAELARRPRAGRAPRPPRAGRLPHRRARLPPAAAARSAPGAGAAARDRGCWWSGRWRLLPPGGDRPRLGHGQRRRRARAGRRGGRAAR